jgi:hypothetical protein
MRRWVDGWLQTPAKVRAPVRMAVESQVGTTAGVEMEVLATRESTTHLQVKCNPAGARQRMIRDDVYMVRFNMATSASYLRKGHAFSKPPLARSFSFSFPPIIVSGLEENALRRPAGSDSL